MIRVGNGRSGCTASIHAYEQDLATQLTRRGLYIRTAKNTAMILAVTDMPAVVVADLFGLSPCTTTRWDEFASTSWSAYLDALAG